MLRKINDHIEEWIMVILLAVSLTAVFVQICMRFFFNNSLAWSEELARYCFIWLIYIGIAYGVKKSSHITVDIIYEMVSEKTKKVFLIVADLLTGVFAIVAIIYGLKVIEQITQFGQVSPALGINMVIVFMSVPVGMTLTFIRLIQNVTKTIKNWNEPLPKTDPLMEGE